MRELLIDQDWRGTAWRTRITGDGVVSPVNGILTTTSSAGSASMLDMFVPILPGMRIEVSALMQWVSGKAGIYIDEMDSGGAFANKSAIEVTARNDWRRITTVWTVPQITTVKFVRIVIGVTTGNAGSAKWQLPIVKIGGAYGTPICIARGLVRVNAGPTVDLHPNYVSIGVASVAFNGSDTVTVTLDHQVMDSPQDVLPIVHVHGTTDKAALPVAGPVVPNGGGSPTFTIKWSDGAAFVNVAAGGWFASFEVNL